MGKRYTHSEEFEDISFRAATPSESLSLIEYLTRTRRLRKDEWSRGDRFKEIFPEGGPIILGRMSGTDEGIYINLPETESGLPLTSESELCLRTTSLSSDGLVAKDPNSDLCFIPYTSYLKWNKTWKGYDFSRKGGEPQPPAEASRFSLIRAIEGTLENSAEVYHKIASRKDYFNWSHDTIFHIPRPLLPLKGTGFIYIYADERSIDICGQSDKKCRDLEGYSFGILKKENMKGGSK